MRRVLLTAVFAGALLVSAQGRGNPAGPEPGSTVETASPQGEHKGAGDEGKWLIWKWVNFVILAAALGYLAGKNAGPFFRSRTEHIQKDMAEARRLKDEAEARAKDIEGRLAAIGVEIDRLRSSAKAEFGSEAQRIAQETERHLKRMGQQTQQEIGLMAKAVRDELRATAARLAIDLAESRIRSRIDEKTESRLVNTFVGGLGSGRPEARQ